MGATGTRIRKRERGSRRRAGGPLPRQWERSTHKDAHSALRSAVWAGRSTANAFFVKERPLLRCDPLETSPPPG
jgi:hypothetical protein